MKVHCEIEEIELEGDYTDHLDNPVLIASVCARCSRCGHETESYGTSAASVRRCLVLMREECPEDEGNWYLAGEDDEDDAW